jgi:hypothetical protein
MLQPWIKYDELAVKQTEKLDETEANKDQKNDDQQTELPPPGPKTEINQKYQSSTDPEATLVRQHGFKTRPRRTAPPIYSVSLLTKLRCALAGNGLLRLAGLARLGERRPSA